MACVLLSCPLSWIADTAAFAVAASQAAPAVVLIRGANVSKRIAAHEGAGAENVFVLARNSKLLPKGASKQRTAFLENAGCARTSTEAYGLVIASVRAMPAI